MKLKRYVTAILATLMLLCVSLPASAKTIAEDDFTITLPEEFVYCFDLSVSEDDPSWALAGIASPSTKLQEYMDNGIVADLYTEDKSVNIQVMVKQNDYSESIYDLSSLNEEELDKVLNELLTSQSDQLSVQREITEVNGQPYYCFQLDGTGLIEAGVAELDEIHEMLVGTIFNGHTLNFDVYNTEEELTQEQLDLLEKTINAVTITQVIPQPESDPMALYANLGLLILLTLMVIVPFIYLPIRTRLDKKQKARMADRLSQYHKTHPAESATGELLFANATECTKEAIHTFSIYQAYVKGLPPLLLGGVMCLVVLIASFALDMEWWVKLISVGVTVYYGYKLINMGNSVQRVQTKVFTRGVSDTARYAFYGDVFRVSGIQSGSVYPYFQILDVRKHSHYLYLYYGPENAYPVDLFGFSLGDTEKFESFIRQKVAEEKANGKRKAA